jgi:mono/diheme cytochrome c family protein
MNYPIWEIPSIGGGSLIALISVLHVYVSHFAVGGGLFIWLTDLRATRTGDAALAAYVRRHTWFFLLVTMVFGGMSGVGIWFIIALVQPQATSLLIHNFVFGWAIEWVFFIGEIAALLVYHYRFEKLARKDRLRVAFLYFAFAWLSMVVINGILSFMLTPGKWVETRSFWDGILNPGYLPSLCFRTSVAVILSGLFALVTAVRIDDEAERRRMVSYASKWLLWPLVPLVPSAAWYYFSLPSELRSRALEASPGGTASLAVFLAATVLVFAGGVAMSLRAPRALQRAVAALLLVIGVGWMGGYEYAREIARKPYVIGEVMYSTGIAKADAAELSQKGVLASAKWTSSKGVEDSSPDAERLAAGKELFRLECLACHTVGGIRNDILPKVKDFTYMGMESLLTGQGAVNSYMPPFVGTEAELDSLALYVTEGLNGKKAATEPDSFEVKPLPTEVPAFDRAKDKYVLLAWNDLGMHCISDNEAYFSFLPPANFLVAQVVERGSPPAIVDQGARIEYAVEKGFEDPKAHVGLWKFAQSLFGTKLPDNVGLFGKGLSGTMDPDPLKRIFSAPGVPVVPYPDDGSYNPYPLFSFAAKDESSGKLLMATTAVAPVSSEMGCRNCHEGPWRTASKSGVSDETSRNILFLHDQAMGTDLLASAKAGKPQLCQSCHADPALAASGKKDVLNFSSAVHGWHANYIGLEDSGACQLCHPSFRKGNTRCLRDLHGSMGFECVDCHGTIKQHAASLLKGQAEKPAARKLLAGLEADLPTQSINGRQPWINEPDCLNCHKGFQAPGPSPSGFNVWTSGLEALFRSRTDSRGIRCEACHGSTHAVYPANNGFGRDRDNIQALQYGGTRGPIGSSMTCSTCHTDKVSDAKGHHPNMSRPFRNGYLLE